MTSAKIFVLVSLGLLFVAVDGCTSFAVGAKATVDGSVMGTHSNDGGGTTDPRLVKIPAQDFESGAMRPIWSSPENYPRYVGSERQASIYFTENCQAGDLKCHEFKPIGYIPQVNHTYAYFEATYGVINEYQVSIGESTCSGVFVGKSVEMGGSALLSVDQLSQIAMERATTSREAVQLMGDLAVEYGFYGESMSFEGGSESLVVIDPTEAWVFHILADPTGTSAIWVAARVPDDSVAVVANMFSIREVDLSDTVNFLGRQDMWDIALEQGLYKEGDPKDFTATFSDGEYSHKYYSGRRMWGIFSAFAPSAGLSATYDDLRYDAPYPFAVPVDKLLTPADLFAVMRSWYEGTEYSTSVGLAGGPYGTPDRFSGSTGEREVSGNWERTIGIYRSSDSFIVQARPNLPNDVGGIVWFGAGAAHSTVFVPILAGQTSPPDCLLYGWQGVYNLTTSYWAHRSLLNLAQIKFNYMIEDIRTLQTTLETQSQELVDAVSAKYANHKLSNKRLSKEELSSITETFNANAQSVQTSTSDLFHTLMFKYADGWINYWDNKGFHADATGYPAWWLEEVGYPDGPPPTGASVPAPEMLPRRSLLSKKRDEKRVNRDAVEEGVEINRDNNNKDHRKITPPSAGGDSSSADKCALVELKACVEACDQKSIAEYKVCAESCIKNCK